MTIGMSVRIRTTGDSYIDQFAGQEGRIENTREVNDGGYHYTQVAIRTTAGDLVWVNEGEYDRLENA